MGGRHAATTQRDFKDRSVVIAVTHPSLGGVYLSSSYLSSQCLATILY